MSSLAAFRDAAIALVVRGDAPSRAVATELAIGVESVILVEGVSDAAAVEALARVREVDLESAGVCVIPMGGVTNIRKYLEALGPHGLGVRVAGMCDADEERYFIRGLEGAGLGQHDSREAMAEVGFFVCVSDLEDELIRRLGPDKVCEVLAAHGDLPAFRTFQNQPAQRERPVERQLQRFFGTTSGRKERYATILVDALDPADPPAPLAAVLSFALGSLP